MLIQSHGLETCRRGQIGEQRNALVQAGGLWIGWSSEPTGAQGQLPGPVVPPGVWEWCLPSPAHRGWVVSQSALFFSNTPGLVVQILKVWAWWPRAPQGFLVGMAAGFQAGQNLTTSWNDLFHYPRCLKQTVAFRW